MPRMNLEGSSSIITGGASGIGEASARQLAAAGSRVVIADLNEAKGQAVASELGGLFVKCDVSSTDDADAAVAAASEMGPLRALVNSAGIGYAGRTIDRNNQPFDLNAFEFVIRVNLIGSFNMLTRSAAAMAQTDPVDDDGSRGAIVNMASAAAYRSWDAIWIMVIERSMLIGSFCLPTRSRTVSLTGISTEKSKNENSVAALSSESNPRSNEFQAPAIL